MDNVMQNNVEKLLKYLLEGESSLPKGEWILLDRGARGWYTRRIGDHRALKIIVGIPS